jgi:hypothetical protein
VRLTTKENWLAAVPWSLVVECNQTLCAKPETPHRPGRGFEATRKLWEAATPQAVDFRQFIELCHRCHALAPFAFFNGNTLAKVLAIATEPVTQLLPPVEATMLRTAAANYVAGAIRARELEETCEHIDEVLGRILAKPKA